MRTWPDKGEVKQFLSEWADRGSWRMLSSRKLTSLLHTSMDQKISQGPQSHQHQLFIDLHVLLLAKGTGSSADSFDNSRKAANYFETGCSFVDWSNPYDLSCREKAFCQKQCLCYIWWQISVLLSAGARKNHLCLLENSYCYWMCMIKSASILNIGPYQTGLFKGTSLAIKLQVMYRNTLKQVFDCRNVPSQRVSALYSLPWHLTSSTEISHTKPSV